MRILLIFLISSAAWAATYTAASCELADVNAVINNTAPVTVGGAQHQAVDSDVIQIPAGSCTWTGPTTGTGTQIMLGIPAGIGITIQGTGNPTSDPTVIGADPSCGQTAITLVATISTAAIAAGPTPTSSLTHLSCIEFIWGSGQVGIMGVIGACNSSGQCPYLRFDNLILNNWTGHPNLPFAWTVNHVVNMYGVMDHVSLNGNLGNSTQSLGLSSINHASDNGPTSFFGDYTWSVPAAFGTDQFIFMENNLFNNAQLGENEGRPNLGMNPYSGFQNSGGSKLVGRFNQFTNMALPWVCCWHGTESGGRMRSGRAWEFYQNNYNCTAANCGAVGTPRGGTGLTWGNSMTQVASGRLTNFWSMQFFRTYVASGTWPACDGTSPYDTNDGQAPDLSTPPTIYFNGTITGVTRIGTNTPYVYMLNILDSTTGAAPTWTPHQWAATAASGNLGHAYSIHNVTQSTGSEIQDNDATTLTIFNGYGAAGTWTPAVDDVIQIARAIKCMDQASGAGAGRLYSLLQGFPTPAFPALPANQAYEPAYFWMDTISPGTAGNNVTAQNSGRFVAGKEWFTETLNQTAQTSPTSPFTGAAPALGSQGGVGHGTLANRPMTCDPNTAYWATDQGNWNHAPGGVQGQLYTCTAANTWTLYYTPYTYPHPLVMPQAAAPPVITSTSPLPAGTANVAYTPYQLFATGSTPITWSAPSVPLGMMLSSAGVLSGTPTATGTSTINVTAMNSLGSAGPMAFSITINAAATPVITSTSPLPPGVINVAYNSYQFMATGTAPITWSATGVPAGMALNSAGVLSGTPTTAATSTVNVTAMNSGGSTAATPFSLTISSVAPSTGVGGLVTAGLVTR